MNYQKELNWNEDKVKLEEVKKWILSKFNHALSIKGPTRIYRSNDWGITAAFKLIYSDNSSYELVCKIGFLSLFKPSPDIYKLLWKSSPTNVPKMLYSDIINNQTWMIFKPFKGKEIKNTKTIDSLLDVTKTMADIQISVSNNLNTKYNKIPTYNLKDIPKIFDSLLNKINNSYLKSWIEDSKNISKNFGISPSDLKKISNYNNLLKLKRDISLLSKELMDYNIPYSIDHIDLHSGNAIVKDDGDILIYDWEEASISSPFFSLDKLLNDAKKLDNKKSNNTLWSKNEALIKEKYINNIPWMSYNKKSRAFDIAMCLSPIKYAHQGTFFIDEVNWEDMAPGLIGESIILALKRCEMI